MDRALWNASTTLSLSCSKSPFTFVCWALRFEKSLFSSVAAVDDNYCPKPPKIDFTKARIDTLPTVIILGRPNVGKSALFNRLIRRREALVYNTPGDHVTRDVREGIAKLGSLRFRVLDTAGLETEATSESILGRTTNMTANILSRVNFAVLLIDARAGLHPLDFEVGKWLRKNSPNLRPIVAMNKCENLVDELGFDEVAEEARTLGFGDAIAISAETGMGMTVLHDSLLPLLSQFMIKTSSNDENGDCEKEEQEEDKLPLQLAIVGRPNVGKSTLLNTLLGEERVLVGPETGLTRDSIRVRFTYHGRTVFLVDTAGWLHRTKREKGASTLSIVQSRKNLMRAQVVALILNAEEIAKAKRCMNHAEVVIMRRAVEEGRALVVVVNKMDTLKEPKMRARVMDSVRVEVESIVPQVNGLPVVFTSALEGDGRQALMDEVVASYKKWCFRISTALLNRWLRKVLSRHSWKDINSQPRVKYMTQVKARPPTFVAFTSAKFELTDTDLRFLSNCLKEDFDLGGIPVRIMHRSAPTKSFHSNASVSKFVTFKTKRPVSDKKILG